MKILLILFAFIVKLASSPIVDNALIKVATPATIVLCLSTKSEAQILYPNWNVVTTAGKLVGWYTVSGGSLATAQWWLQIDKDTIGPGAGLWIYPRGGVHFPAIAKEASLGSVDTLYAQSAGLLKTIKKADLTWGISQVTGLQTWINNDALVFADTLSPIYTDYKAEQERDYMQSWATSNFISTETDPLSLHLSDTSDFLQKTTAAHLYQPKGSYLTSEVDPLSLHIGDTSTMLDPYARKQSVYTKSESDVLFQPAGSYATSSQVALKVNISDTAAMLDPYLTEVSAASTYQPVGAYITNVTQGYGTIVTGTTNKTVAVDSTIYMTKDAAQPIINTMQGEINNNTNGKMAKSANLSDVASISTARGNLGFSVTTVGTSGPSTYNSSTRVFNIPDYAPGTGTVTSVGLTSTDFTVSNSPITSNGNITANLTTTGVGAGNYNFVTVDTKGRVTAGTNESINDNPGRTLVTTTSSTGFQISSTRNAEVSYEGTFQTTTTIGGPASITVFLETANTNSTTPGDWTIIAQQTNSSTATLAIVINIVDIEPWSLTRTIPAGKFVRIRYGSVTGTASASINTQQQEVTK